MKDDAILTLGADLKDYYRSSIAQKIFSLAQQASMQFAHYEYRWPIPVPATWLPSQIDENQGQSVWSRGVLAESKYQSFRHDSSVCNFHPGQSSKWGAHELCHKLVGFAYRPDGDLLFYTLAAWAAEVLPVTVYYFWDEVDSHKCLKHKDSYAPASFCADCEGVAKTGENKNIKLIQEGWNFLNSQLAAIEASIEQNRLLPAQHMNLDLADDAYFYTLAQLPRLQSDLYQNFVASYVPKDMYFTDLFSFLSHIRKMAKVLQGDLSTVLLPHDWKRLDIGFRGLELSESVEGEAKEKLLHATHAYLQSGLIDTYVKSYSQIYSEYELPEMDQFFGTGYEVLGDLGFCKSQMREGIQSIFEETPIKTDAFIAQDRNTRQYLGDRIAAFDPSEDVRLEVFLQKPLHFYPKEYTMNFKSDSYQLSKRAGVFKNTDLVKKWTGLDSSYVLLYKDYNGEILSFSLSEKMGQMLLSAKDQSFLADELEDFQNYLQNGILLPS